MNDPFEATAEPIINVAAGPDLEPTAETAVLSVGNGEQPEALTSELPQSLSGETSASAAETAPPARSRRAPRRTAGRRAKPTATAEPENPGTPAPAAEEAAP